MTDWRAGGLGALALVAAMTTGASGAPSTEAAEVQTFHIGGVRLGVQLGEVPAADAAGLGLDGPTGARVVEVTEDSPAEAAGIRPGDVILEYDGEAVRGVAHLTRLVRETPPGREVAVALVRGGQRQTLTVAPEERRLEDLFGGRLPLRDFRVPESFAFDFDRPDHGEHGPADLWGLMDDRPRLGIRFQEISGQLAAYFGAPGGSGVLVAHVDPDGPAARAGLEAGDLVLELAGRSVRTGSDLRRALRDAEVGEPVGLRALRRGQEKSLEVVLEERRPPRPRGEAL